MPNLTPEEVCEDCSNGLHRDCSETFYSPDAEGMVSCPCSVRGHGAEELLDDNGDPVTMTRVTAVSETELTMEDGTSLTTSAAHEVQPEDVIRIFTPTGEEPLSNLILAREEAQQRIVSAFGVPSHVMEARGAVLTREVIERAQESFSRSFGRAPQLIPPIRTASPEAASDVPAMVEHISEAIRRSLSSYVGQPNSEAVRAGIEESIRDGLNEALQSPRPPRRERVEPEPALRTVTEFSRKLDLED